MLKYKPIAPGVNIFSGEIGLGAALTNPTELGRSKGNLRQRYPVVFENREYADVETAWHVLKTGDLALDNDLMARLIAHKFRQHPRLFEVVMERGGLAWLRQCRHITGARSESSQRWEGDGLESRFIQCLVAGFELAARAGPIPDGPQQRLF